MDQWKLSPVFSIALLLVPLTSSSIGLFPVPMQFDEYVKDSASTDPNLVERRIRFPGLDHVLTGEDLGHYAGYFKLPRSYDAKYNQRDVYDQQINKMLPMCEMGIKLCEACVPIYWFCINAVFFGILHAAGDVNYHDIRMKCEGNLCYDYSNLKSYLNQESAKAALGVPKGLEFSVCNSRLDDMMLMDRMKNIQPIVQDLLDEGVKVLVYAGEYSFFLNYLGNWRWVHAMDWSGQKYFTSAPQVRFDVEGHEFGALKSYGPLTFLKVFDAGNFVPMDQPKAALEMMKR